MILEIFILLAFFSLFLFSGSFFIPAPEFRMTFALLSLILFFFLAINAGNIDKFCYESTCTVKTTNDQNTMTIFFGLALIAFLYSIYLVLLVANPKPITG